MRRRNTAEELFPYRESDNIGRNDNKRTYSSFIDVRDLEWAGGHGLRCQRKTEKVVNK